MAAITPSTPTDQAYRRELLGTKLKSFTLATTGSDTWASPLSGKVVEWAVCNWDAAETVRVAYTQSTGSFSITSSGAVGFDLLVWVTE